jgi:transposase
MSLPHSGAVFVKAYPGETTEAFCDGHVSAFAFFGGNWWDHTNTKTGYVKNSRITGSTLEAPKNGGITR